MRRGVRLLSTMVVMAVVMIGCVSPVSFLPRVELTGITPDSGQVEGGTQVTIRGRNFAQLHGNVPGLLQDLNVLVCGVPLESLELKVLEQRTVMLPPASHVGISLGNEITGVVGQGGDPSATDVVLVQPGGGRVVLEGAFECVQPAAVAALAAEPTEGTAPLTVLFDASGSSSATGTIATYQWDFGDGTVSDEMSPSHTFTSVGDYTVTLSVEDDAGATDEASVVITVMNSAPVAVLSVDPASGTQVAPAQVTLDASASSDPDGDDLSFVWTVDDVVVAENAVATHTFASGGTYRVGLTVTDVHGLSSSDSLDYLVGNAVPVAVISNDPDPAIGFAPLLVEFDASASSDPDGEIVAYEWDFGDGTTASGVEVSHVFTSVGANVVSLLVRDDDGATDEASVQVIVQNTAPVAVLAVDPASGTEVAPLTVTLDASGSSDADGDDLGFVWTVDDVVVAETAVATYTFLRSGSYEIGLAVTDVHGESSGDSLVYVVGNAVPVAVIATDPSPAIGFAPLSVEFDASASSDPDGVIVSYEWDFGDGTTTSVVEASHVFNSVGTFVVELEVLDSDGATGEATRVVTVLNSAPVAVVGADPASGTAVAPLTVTLDASASSDPDGDALGFVWTVDDVVVAENAVATHTFASGGTYRVGLTVTDVHGLSSSDSLDYVVGNAVPVAVISNDPDPAIGFAPLLVEFDASASSDPDGEIVSYVWDFGDGTTASGVEVSHVFTSVGAHDVRLLLRDDGGATDEASVQVIVQNTAPVAVLAVDPASGTVVAPLTVTLDASGSSDADGDDLGFVWTVDDVVVAETAVATYMFSRSGSYEIGLAVTDVHGESSGDSLVYVVGNAPPVALFSTDPDPASGPGPLTVEFDASGSSDPDGTVVSYEWDFGAGVIVDTAVATHTFASLGRHPVTLTVWDDGGASHQATVTVTVQNTPPVAVLFSDPASGTAVAPLPVTFDATGSSDSDGDDLNYAWTVDDVLVSEAAQTMYTFARSGDYEVVLTVSDEHGATDTEEITYQVGNATPLAVIETTPDPASGTAPLTVQFDASGSVDPDGSVVAYAWDFAGLASSASVTASHTFARSGTYTVKLTVTDDEDADGVADLVVTVDNAAPTASFVHDLDPQSNTAPMTVTFDAGASHDPDGSIASYVWDFGDGGTATGVSPTYTFAKHGDHLVTLTVTDDENAQDDFSATLTVGPAEPQAVALVTGTSGYQVRFSAAGSTDPDGTIESYSWDFGDGKSGTGETVTHTYGDSTARTVTLTVTDDDDQADTATVQASPVNLPPTAVIRVLSSEPAPIGSGTFLSLVSDSTDQPGGSIESQTWEYEGTVRTGTYFYDTLYGAGPHEITLTVFDNEGASDSTVYEFTVPTVLQVDVVETTLYLDPGDTRQLNVNVTTIGGATEEVEWTSSDPAIVRVDQDGQVTVLGRGHVTITATSKFVSSFPDDSRLRDNMLVASSGPVPHVVSLGTAQHEEISDVALDAAGNIYLAGAVTGHDPAGSLPDAVQQDMLLIKLDSLGNELWRRSYSSPGNDHAIAVAVDQASGEIVLVGWTDDSFRGATRAGGQDAVILRLDDRGNVLWSRQLGTPGDDQAVAVVLDPAGNVYTTGTLNSASRNCTSDCSRAFVTRHSTTGQLIWYETLGTGSRNAMGSGLTLDQAGNVVMTGMHEALRGQLIGVVDAYIWTLNNATGAELRLHLFGTHAADRSNDLIVEPDGQILWLGGDNAGIDPSYVETKVRRMDATSGTISLDRPYYSTGVGIHSARSVALMANQNYVMGGFRWLARVFVSGHERNSFDETWYQEYQGSGRNTTFAGVVVDQYGRVIVAGHTRNDADELIGGNVNPFLLFFEP